MDPNHGRKTIAVITAHPDDEMGLGSVLAHYVDRGVRVHLVCLTSGQKGFRSHTDITDSEELARVRRGELRRAAHILGVEPPTVLEFVDQELLGPAQDRIREELTRVLDDLEPDVVLTFGPDGVTGHPDHRAVSCLVTEILQAREDGSSKLYYHELPLGHVVHVAERTGRTLLGVAPRYLTTRIEVSPEEVERGIRAIGEYRSQFAPDALEELQKTFRGTTGEVWFRQVLPPPDPGMAVASTLFERD